MPGNRKKRHSPVHYLLITYNHQVNKWYPEPGTSNFAPTWEIGQISSAQINLAKAGYCWIVSNILADDRQTKHERVVATGVCNINKHSEPDMINYLRLNKTFMLYLPQLNFFCFFAFVGQIYHKMFIFRILNNYSFCSVNLFSKDSVFKLCHSYIACWFAFHCFKAEKKKNKKT